MATNNTDNRKGFKLDNIVSKLLQSKPSDANGSEDTVEDEQKVLEISLDRKARKQNKTGKVTKSLNQDDDDDVENDAGSDVESVHEVEVTHHINYNGTNGDSSDSPVEMEIDSVEKIPAAKVIALGDVQIDDVLVKLEPLDSSMENSIAGLEKMLGVKIQDEISQEEIESSESEGDELPHEVQCTACRRYVDPSHGQISRHPILNVLVCKKCIKYYNSSPFGRDDQGIEEQCRWCGDGGELICCDKCDRAICQKCIKRNVGKDALKALLDSDESDTWFCYCCDQTPIAKHLKYCNKILKLVEEIKFGESPFKNREGATLINGPNQRERRNRLSSISEDIGVPIGDNTQSKKDKDKRSKEKNMAKRKDSVSEDSDDRRKKKSQKKKKAKYKRDSDSESEVEYVKHKSKKVKRDKESDHEDRKKKRSKSKKHEISDSESESEDERKSLSKKEKKILSSKQKTLKIVLKPHSKKKVDEDEDMEESSADEKKHKSIKRKKKTVSDSGSEEKDLKSTRKKKGDNQSDEDMEESIEEDRKSRGHKKKQKSKSKKRKENSSDEETDEDMGSYKKSKSKKRKENSSDEETDEDADSRKKSKSKKGKVVSVDEETDEDMDSRKKSKSKKGKVVSVDEDSDEDVDSRKKSKSKKGKVVSVDEDVDSRKKSKSKKGKDVSVDEDSDEDADSHKKSKSKKGKDVSGDEDNDEDMDSDKKSKSKKGKDVSGDEDTEDEIKKENTSKSRSEKGNSGDGEMKSKSKEKSGDKGDLSDVTETIENDKKENNKRKHKSRSLDSMSEDEKTSKKSRVETIGIDSNDIVDAEDIPIDLTAESGDEVTNTVEVPEKRILRSRGPSSTDGEKSGGISDKDKANEEKTKKSKSSKMKKVNESDNDNELTKLPKKVLRSHCKGKNGNDDKDVTMEDVLSDKERSATEVDQTDEETVGKIDEENVEVDEVVLLGYEDQQKTELQKGKKTEKGDLDEKGEICAEVSMDIENDVSGENKMENENEFEIIEENDTDTNSKGGHKKKEKKKNSDVGELSDEHSDSKLACKKKETKEKRKGQHVKESSEEGEDGVHKKGKQAKRKESVSDSEESLKGSDDKNDRKERERKEKIKGKTSKESTDESEGDVKIKRKVKGKERKKKDTSSEEEESDSDITRKGKGQEKSKKRKESSDESEDDTWRRKSKRKAQNKKSKQRDDSSEETDSEEDPKPKKKGRQKYQDDSSDEDSDAPSTKIRTTSRRKKKSPTSSEDEEEVIQNSRKTRSRQKPTRGKPTGGIAKSKKKKPIKSESSSSASDSDSAKIVKAKKNVYKRSRRNVSESSDGDLSGFVEQSVGKKKQRGKGSKGKETRSRAVIKKGKSKKVLELDEETSEESEEEESEEEESEEESSESGVRTRRGKKQQSHKKQTRRRGRRPSSSDEDTKKNNKSSRRRKKNANSDDSDSPVQKQGKRRKAKGKKRKPKRKKFDDSDSHEEDVSPTKKGRKRIRNIMEDDKLTEETRKARRLEEERRQRLLEKTKILEEEGLPVDSGKINKLILEKNAETGEPVVEVAQEIVKHLKVHQADGIKFMYNNVIESVALWKEGNPGAGCILAQCMGLGKTLQVVSLIHTLTNHKEIQLQTTLVVAPLNTVLNWEVEFDKWLSVDERMDVFVLNGCKDTWHRADLLHQWNKYGGVMIIGYEMYRNLTQLKRIRSKKQKKILFETLVDPGPQLVVCDEAHILRNDKSAISIALNAVKTKRRIALTGTPLQNNLIEYHCMMTFVKPNLLGTQKEFSNHFVNPIKNGQCRDSTPADVRHMKHRSHILHKMLEGCVQRKDYSVLLPFLPAKHEYVISVRLSSVQQKMYQHYLSTFVFPEGITKRGMSLFSDFQALMRIWTHPICLRLEAARRPEVFEESDSMESFIDDDEEEDEANSSSSENLDFIQSDSSANEGRKTRGRTQQKKPNKLKTSSSSSTSEEDDSDDKVVEVMPSKGSSTRPGLTISNESKPGTSKLTNGNLKTEPDIFVLNIEDMNATKQIGSTRSGATFKESPNHVEVDENGEVIIVEEEKEWYDEFLGEGIDTEIEESGKLVLLLEILADSQAVNDKVIVFSQSLVTLDLIERTLGGGVIGGNADDWCRGCDYFRMDGSTSAQMRQRWADIFNDEENKDARLFLISTKAGGLGINLVAANRIIVFDASWNPSHDTQSIFRAYRFGQNKPVFVYRLIAQGTMEEKIYERQVTKLSLSERVIDEHQVQRHFTAADLAELYNFVPDKLDEEKERPTPVLPKDAILADLINRLHPKWIVKFHEHDTLLRNIAEEELSEEERQQAWAMFEAEKNSDKSAFINMQWRMHQESIREQAQQNVAENFARQNFAQQNLSQQNLSQQNLAQQNLAQQNFAQQNLGRQNPGAAYMQQQAQMILRRQQMEQEIRRQRENQQRENQRQQQLSYLNHLLGSQQVGTPAQVQQSQIPIIRPGQVHVMQQNQARQTIPQQPVRVQIIGQPGSNVSMPGRPANNSQQVRVRFVSQGATSGQQFRGQTFVGQPGRFPGQSIVINPSGNYSATNQFSRYKQARPGQIVEIVTSNAGNSHQSSS